MIPVPLASPVEMEQRWILSLKLQTFLIPSFTTQKCSSPSLLHTTEKGKENTFCTRPWLSTSYPEYPQSAGSIPCVYHLCQKQVQATPRNFFQEKHIKALCSFPKSNRQHCKNIIPHTPVGTWSSPSQYQIIFSSSSPLINSCSCSNYLAHTVS